MASPNPQREESIVSIPAPAPGDPYVYDHIPKLGPHHPGDQQGSLLPDKGGVPGYVYAQIPVTRCKEFNNESPPWLRTHGCQIYTIVGPAGHIDCELLAQGAMIKGISSESGARRCYVHKDIYETTGIQPGEIRPAPIELMSMPESPQATERKPRKGAETAK